MKRASVKSTVFGVNPLALFLCAAVLYGTTPMGFNTAILTVKAEVDAYVQRSKPRPGPFTDPRRPVWLGTNPGRDPEHLTDRWNGRALRALQNIQAKERRQLNDRRWGTISRVLFENSLLTGEPAPYEDDGGATTTTTSTSTTTTGGTTGGGPGGFTDGGRGGR